MVILSTRSPPPGRDVRDVAVGVSVSAVCGVGFVPVCDPISASVVAGPFMCCTPSSCLSCAAATDTDPRIQNESRRHSWTRSAAACVTMELTRFEFGIDTAAAVVVTDGRGGLFGDDSVDSDDSSRRGGGSGIVFENVNVVCAGGGDELVFVSVDDVVGPSCVVVVVALDASAVLVLLLLRRFVVRRWIFTSRS